MSGNIIGQCFRLVSFGESHGNSIGGVLEGCPSGLELDFEAIAIELQRRLPDTTFTTSRKETEKVEFLSGIFEGKTLGTPIAFRILNENIRSEDYQHLKEYYRPSHADRVYQEKYGIRDYRGGGRASGRETVARVVGGSIAKQFLRKQSIQIQAYVSAIGPVFLHKKHTELDLSLALKSETACPDMETTTRMIRYLDQIKEGKDSTGGIIDCVIEGCPIGIGEPVFDRLSADLAKAMLSIPTCKGFAFGSGWESTQMKGSEYIDLYENDFRTITNHSGGIQGGISNGETIYFTVPFRPVGSIQKPIQLISQSGNQSIQTIGGRHDVCHVLRVVPIVEGMAALVIADHIIRYTKQVCQTV